MKEGLKKQLYLLHQSLTSLRMAKLKDAREKYGFSKAWTSDGSIVVMEKGSAKPKVIYR